MNDDQKTKEQLLEELALAQGRIELERERSSALQEVSKRVASAHDTDEVLDLIMNEAVRLIGAAAGIIRLLDGNRLVLRAATASSIFPGSAASQIVNVEKWTSLSGHVMTTKKPLSGEDAAKMLTSEARQLFVEQGRDPAAISTLPLLANDQSIGTISVSDTTYGRRFTEDEISLLMAFADQAALALEKARLLNEAETERERADSLYRVSNLLAGAHDTDAVLNLIVNEAARLVGATTVFIRLLEGDSLVLRAGTRGDANYEPTEETPIWVANLLAHVMTTKKPLFGEEVVGWMGPDLLRTIEKQGGDPAAGGVVPLVANDQSIGTLAVADFDHRGRRFKDDEIALLMGFADQAALALEKARLVNEAETEKERAETERERADSLYRVSNLLAGAHDTDEVLDLIVNEAARLIDVRLVLIRLLEGDSLVLRARTHAFGYESQTIYRVGEGTSMPGHALATQKPFFGEEATKLIAPEARRALEKQGGGPVAAGSVPILANGQSIGTLSVADIDNPDRRFKDDEISLLMAFADQAALALEKARLLSEAEQRTAELAATNQELEAFSYSVTHDLRAPLRGIDGFSQALMNEYSDVLDEQAQHYLQRVRIGRERMGQLIDDLLALLQVTRGEMRRENVDLSDLARTIVTGLQERDPQRQVEFVIQDGVALNGDTRLLRVALENLLGNAWKYARKKEEARIEFGLTEADGKPTCFVRDDGSGFDMAYADRLFGAFQRLHDASEFEGSGVGLATVQRIINRHGGRIWAESAVGEGATFYFTLS